MALSLPGNRVSGLRPGGAVDMKRLTMIKALGICLASLSVSTHLGAAEASAVGKQVFGRWCIGCHADSPFAPGTIYLRQTRAAELAVIEQRSDLAPEYIETLVRKGLGGMPSFRRTEIDNAELEALINYLTSGSSGVIKNAK